MRPAISVIVPMLDEAAGIQATLQPLQAWRAAGHEVLVVDGGSRDASVERAAPLADAVLHAGRGRARQMNHGAAAARGEVLLFLHADTRLPADALCALQPALAAGAGWGRFDVRLSARRPLFRLLGALINLRSRLTGIATGDQAIFVRRAWFEDLGGYPEIPLMEDVALSRSLKRRARPACLRTRVTTSSRRWEEHGPWRTIVLMWRLRFDYWRGVDPARLAQRYRTRRAERA